MKRGDPARAFFWIVYAFLAMVWVFTINDPFMQRWQIAVPFTVLMVAAAVLHGSIGRWNSPDRAPLYAVVQTLIAAVLVLLGDGKPLLSALFFPVAGEVFGLFPGAVQRVVSLAGLVTAWAVTLLISSGMELFRQQVPGAVLGLAFVGIYVTLFTRQANERERAEKLLAELEAAHNQLRSYAMQIEELSVTEERQRMARELHDTLAQGLAGLIMQLEAVDTVLSRGDVEKARTITARATERARAALVEARGTIQNLRSPLEHKDLVEEIRHLVESLRAETGMSCVFEVGPGNLRLAGPVADQLFRLVQEGLTNVKRHSQAGQVGIRLQAANGHAELSIIDNGVGFDPAAVPAGHFGLTGLQERVRLMGGTLRIESQPGRGTRLHAAIPLGED